MRLFILFEVLLRANCLICMFYKAAIHMLECFLFLGARFDKLSDLRNKDEFAKAIWYAPRSRCFDEINQ